MLMGLSRQNLVRGNQRIDGLGRRIRRRSHPRGPERHRLIHFGGGKEADEFAARLLVIADSR